MKIVYGHWIYGLRLDGSTYRVDLVFENPDLVGDPNDKDIKFIVANKELPKPQEPEIELECRVEYIDLLYGIRYFKTVSGFKAWKKLPWYKKFKKHESEED